MTVTVFHDTFTDTAGTSQDSHTPEIGGPWWLAWTRLIFKGHVKRGDNPSTQPHED